MKNVKSQDKTYKYYQAMLTNRVIKMFEWSNLPESVDVDFLNYTLINTGSICFTKFNGKIYALFGNVGGEPNEYYFPTIFIIANPVLGSKQVTIDKDGIVMYNSTIDRFTTVPKQPGESPLKTLIDITAQRLTEITISALTACKNIRAAILMSAKDDETRTAAEQALTRIYNGDPAVVFKDKIIESLNITINPGIDGSARALAELREEYQFELAQFYHAIGVQSNFNMKRERLNTSEVNANTDSLLINIADMLYQRQTACEKINSLYGTSISVDFSEEWKNTAALQNNSAGESADPEPEEQDKEEVQTDDS